MNEPDAFLGAVMAFEGIPDATVLLHGQNGCRKALLLSQKICPRPDRIVDLELPIYLGRPVVPFSGVNQADYTGNSFSKLSRAVDSISREDYALIGLICSPGISIIGDDLGKAVNECGIAGRTLIIDNSDLGDDLPAGFDSAIASILGKFCVDGRMPVKDTITAVGLSITHKDWRSVIDELNTVSSLLGLNIICFTGAGSDVNCIRSSINAEYVLDLAPDFSSSTRCFYESKGLKTISIGKSPVGFDSVKELILRIAETTGKNPDKALHLLQEYRRRAYECIVSSGKSLRGHTFCISAPDSIKVPLKDFLEKSFSMKYSENEYEYLFANGNRCVMEKASEKCSRCIDIGFPSDKVDFSRNPILGIYGTMYLLDSLFL